MSVLEIYAYVTFGYWLCQFFIAVRVFKVMDLYILILTALTAMLWPMAVLTLAFDSIVAGFKDTKGEK